MNQIIEFNEFEAKMQEFKRQYDGVVYDLTIPDQEKKARSDRYTIGKVISALDERHKEIKAPLKEKVDLIDGERKRIKDELLDVQVKIKSQIDAHEAKIQAHQDMLTAKVEALQLTDLMALSICPSIELHEICTALENQVIDESYEDHKEEAESVRRQSVAKLKELIIHAQKREAEQAELDKLRKESEARIQAERDEKIRKEASERAQREAEEKAKREIEAAQRKQYEAEQAAKRAEQEARDKMEREQREAAAKAEAERKAEEARKAKTAHRKKIETAATLSLFDCGIDNAEKVVDLIKEGKIANVTINY